MQALQNTRFRRIREQREIAFLIQHTISSPRAQTLSARILLLVASGNICLAPTMRTWCTFVQVSSGRTAASKKQMRMNKSLSRRSAQASSTSMRIAKTQMPLEFDTCATRSYQRGSTFAGARNRAVPASSLTSRTWRGGRIHISHTSRSIAARCRTTRRLGTSDGSARGMKCESYERAMPRLSMLIAHWEREP